MMVAWPTLTPRHVGDGVERSGAAIERDADVARPLWTALRRGISRGRQQQKGQTGSPDQGAAGERKMK
jgi:hypothetical protein